MTIFVTSNSHVFEVQCETLDQVLPVLFSVNISLIFLVGEIFDQVLPVITPPYLNFYVFVNISLVFEVEGEIFDQVLPVITEAFSLS